MCTRPYGFILITNEPDGRARVRINGVHPVPDICGSRDRPNLPMAAIAGDDDLLVGPAGEAPENCLGCGRSMPADSEYAFCARCE